MGQRFYKFVQARRRWLATALASVLLACMPGAMVLAAISQGYHSDQPEVPGTLVSISSGHAVTPAGNDTSDQLLGVVVASGEAAIAVGQTDSNLQVATTGNATVFVSTLGGAIKSGDKISPSPIVGVGMKATTSSKVLGVAVGDFDGTGGRSVEVKGTNGPSKTVMVGTVPVQIQVGYYTPATANSVVPAALQNFANALTGRQVSVLRILLTSLIMAGAILVTAIMLFSAVRSSLISVGRNPLAQRDIYKGLLQVLLTSVAVLGIASGGSYLILNY